jgi:DnaJ family protein C protein 11
MKRLATQSPPHRPPRQNKSTKQVISTRQIWRTTTGECRWIVGPQPGGVSLAIAHRGAGWGTTGRVELSGGGASLQLRATWDATEATQLRGVLRLTAMGPDLEVGAEHRFNSITSGYVGTQVGLRSGVLLRVRCRRSKQTFEFPVLLSSDAREWQMFAASALLPPLASLVMHRLVVRPFVSWRRGAAARAARREHAEGLRAAHLKAAREAALLLPVARRRAGLEAAVDGLIVLEAVYGDLPAWREAVKAGKEVRGSAAAPRWPPQAAGDGAAAAATEGASGGQQQQQEVVELVDAAQEQASSSGGGEASAAAAVAAAAAAAAADDEPPPPYLDVTAALQYLVAAGSLDLHPGVSKRGLMGFADVAPEGTEKRLYVGYFFNGGLLEKEVGDADMLKLPAAGQAVADAAVAERLRARLAVVVAAAGGASGGGAAGAAAAGASGGADAPAPPAPRRGWLGRRS